MRKFAVAAFALVLAVAMAADAFARAGRSGSLGSRGSRTYDRPMERTITPAPAPGPQAPMVNKNAVQQPAAAAPMAQQRPGFFARNPMLGGLMAGFLGAGLFGLLFNSSAFAGAGEAAPFASFLGMAFQIALIGGLVFLAMRLFRRRAEPVPAGGTPGHARTSAFPATGGVPAARVEKEFEPEAFDKDAFTDVILGVQAAWSAGDMLKLRGLATPEVVSWISEDLERDASRGVRNIVEDVELLAGDVVESWREGEREFVTARITFSARDYGVDANGGVVEGDAERPVEATELWTFVRVQGGRWILAAIEQV